MFQSLMNENADWLAIEEKPVVVPTKNVDRSQRAEASRFRRELGIPQRAYLDALVECRFHVINANALYRSRGFVASASALGNWRRTDTFSRAMELEASIIMAGITPARIIARVDELAAYGAEEVDLYDRLGEITGRKVKRDPQLALKANELLGKNQKLWGDDEKSNRVTVNIVDMTGRQALNDDTPIIDGEAVRIE